MILHSRASHREHSTSLIDSSMMLRIRFSSMTRSRIGFRASISAIVPSHTTLLFLRLRRPISTSSSRTRSSMRTSRRLDQRALSLTAIPMSYSTTASLISVRPLRSRITTLDQVRFSIVIPALEKKTVPIRDSSDSFLEPMTIISNP